VIVAAAALTDYSLDCWQAFRSGRAGRSVTAIQNIGVDNVKADFEVTDLSTPILALQTHARLDRRPCERSELDRIAQAGRTDW
jgi:hypothetical protein